MIDALAAWLRRLPTPEQERLRPPHLPALVRIFPVLDAVWTSDRVESPPEAPHELRRLGLVALRTLLTRLAETRTLIVRRARRLEARVRALVEQTGDLAAEQLLEYALGLTRGSAGRLTEATDGLGRLCIRLDQEPTYHWLRALTITFYLGLANRLGRWHEFASRLPQWLTIARERGNPSELAELEASSAITYAYLGQPARAGSPASRARGSARTGLLVQSLPGRLL